MKIALISDLHIGDKKSDKVFQESQIRFLKNQFVKELKEKNIKTIVVCGDTFDTRYSVNVQTDNVVIDLFKNTFKDFDVHVIAGNHDIYYTTTTEINSLKAISLLNNVKVYEKPETVVFENNEVLMLPWVTNYDDFGDLLDKNYKYAFAHLDIVGFDLGGGRLCTKGLTVSEVTSKIEHTYTGHYHKRDRKTFKDNRTITYIGSPYQMTRIDRNEKRGYAILDLSNNNFEWVDNTESIEYIEFKFPNVDLSLVNKNVIDLKIPYDYQDSIKNINKVIKEIDNENPAYPVNVFYLPKAMEETKEIELNVDSFNLSTLFKIYIDNLEDDINKEELYEKLIELYNISKGGE